MADDPADTTAAAAAAASTGSGSVPDAGKVQGSGAGDSGSAGANQTQADSAGAASAADDTQTQDYRDRRIARLTARLRESEEQRAELQRKAQAAPASASGAAGASGEKLYTQAELAAEAERIAAQRTVISEFNRICNECVTSGRKTFSDWDQKISVMRDSLTASDPQAATSYNAMVQAAIETGDGPNVIYELASDLNEAERIMTLSPSKMGIELARRASDLQGVRRTGAPPPLRPLTTRGATREMIDPTDPERGAMLPKGEWFKRRQAQIDARAKGSA